MSNTKNGPIWYPGLNWFRPRPHYARGIWKWSFLKTLLKTEEFRNRALHFSVDRKHFENGAFRKWWHHDNLLICLPKSSPNTNQKWRPKWWLPCWFCHVGSTKTLLCASSPFHSSVSVACDCCVFKLLRHSVDGKHFIHFLVWTKNIWCVFRVKPPFSNSSSVLWTGPWSTNPKDRKRQTDSWKNEIILQNSSRLDFFSPSVA